LASRDVACETVRANVSDTTPGISICNISDDGPDWKTYVALIRDKNALKTIGIRILVKAEKVHYWEGREGGEVKL
jgi:hypothetical protein